MVVINYWNNLIAVVVKHCKLKKREENKQTQPTKTKTKRKNQTQHTHTKPDHTHKAHSHKVEARINSENSYRRCLAEEWVALYL